MSAGYACALKHPPRGRVLAMGLHALSLLLHQQLIADVERFESSVELRLPLPPLCPLDVSPADFGHSEELIDRSYRASKKWLEGDHPTTGQAQFLMLHRH